MSERINMADPEFEPTDEHLRLLSREAFADVRRAHVASLTELRQRIAAERVEVLRRLESRPRP